MFVVYTHLPLWLRNSCYIRSIPRFKSTSCGLICGMRVKSIFIPAPLHEGRVVPSSWFRLAHRTNVTSYYAAGPVSLITLDWHDSTPLHLVVVVISILTVVCFLTWSGLYLDNAGQRLLKLPRHDISWANRNTSLQGCTNKEKVAHFFSFIILINCVSTKQIYLLVTSFVMGTDSCDNFKESRLMFWIRLIF